MRKNTLLSARINKDMIEMLRDCYYREQTDMSPCLDYEMATAKQLVDLGYVTSRILIEKGGRPGVAYFLTEEGAAFLDRGE
jgi:hypothetical protein